MNIHVEVHCSPRSRQFGSTVGQDRILAHSLYALSRFRRNQKKQRYTALIGPKDSIRLLNLGNACGVGDFWNGVVRYWASGGMYGTVCIACTVHNRVIFLVVYQQPIRSVYIVYASIVSSIGSTRFNQVG